MDRLTRDKLRLKRRNAQPVMQADADLTEHKAKVNIAANSTSITALLAADVALDARLDVLELPLRVKGRRNSPQTSIPTATSTFVDFAAPDDYDFTSWHDHASGTLSVRESFTVPATGTYLIVATAKWAGPALTAMFRTEVTVNGTALPETVEEAGVLAGDVYIGQLVAVAALTSGDVLKMRVRQQSTTSLDLNAAVFAITRVYP